MLKQFIDDLKKLADIRNVDIWKEVNCDLEEVITL